MSWSTDDTVTAFNAANRRFFYFAGDLYLSNNYLWRRAGVGNWVAVNIAGSQAHSAWVWNGLMWAHQGNNIIYRTSDGSAWVADIDVNATWGTTISISTDPIGGQGDYLYLGHSNTGNNTTYFARRDTNGVWTNNVADAVSSDTAPLTNGIINFGGYLFWAHNNANLPSLSRKWDGSSWSDARADGKWIWQYIIFDSNLYGIAADGNDIWVIRWNDSYWVTEYKGIDNITGDLSLGDDGRLYLGTGNLGEIHVRSSVGRWPTRYTHTTASYPGPAIAYGGDLFFSGGNWPGTFYIYIGDLVYTGHPSGSGISSNALACDGNGNTVYIAIYNGSSNPILITAGLPLTATAIGNLAYNPGAGDAINVKTHYEVGDFSIIAGHFGNNEQARRSKDGGATYSDIDPDTWAANKAQPIAIDPNDEEHVLLALDALDDLVEKDVDDAWTVLDAALPFDVGAMAIYDLDPDEIVIARINAGAVMIQYSPNNASTWQDITGALPVTDGIASLELV